MMRSSTFLSVAIALLLLTACGAETEAPQAPPAVSSTPASAAPSDPSGTWRGDWGPNERDRNEVTLDLQWDGTNLRGIVNPGPNPIELKNTSFDPATGAVKMEADVQSRGGVSVHYTIEGKVEGNTMTGSWSHDENDGTFVITKS